MRVVSDESGAYYVLQQAADGDCRVRHITSGSVTSRPCESLSPVAPAKAIETLSGDDERAVGASNSPAAVGLLLELAVSGPASARQLLDRFDVCESDLHGAVTELRAAGLVHPTSVYGERGYRAASEIAVAETD